MNHSWTLFFPMHSKILFKGQLHKPRSEIDRIVLPVGFTAYLENLTRYSAEMQEKAPKTCLTRTSEDELPLSPQTKNEANKTAEITFFRMRDSLAFFFRGLFSARFSFSVEERACYFLLSKRYRMVYFRTGSVNLSLVWFLHLKYSNANKETV